MSNLSELIGSGQGGGKTLEFIASGTLASGKNVILNANGTVSLSAEATATQAIPDGGQQTGPAYSYGGYYTFLPATPNKIVWVWTNSSGYFVCNIGTVSGTTVTFGADTYPLGSVSNAMSPLQIEADPTQPNRLLVLGGNSSQYGCLLSGILVNGAMVWSTLVVIISKINFTGRLSFDPATTTTSKFAVSYGYRDYNPNNWAAACIAGYMPLGNTAPAPTIGTQVIFKPSITSYPVSTITMGMRPDVAGNFVLLYRETGYSPPGGYYSRGCQVAAGTGTTITLGAAVRWSTASGAVTQIAFDPSSTAGKFIMVYGYRPNTNAALAARVGTLSGSSVSFGSEQNLVMPPYDKNAGMTSQGVSFQANTGGIFSMVYHSWYSNSEPYRARCRLATYSGTTITFQTEILLPNIYAGNALLQAGDPNNPGFFIINPSASNAGVWACQMAVPVPNTTVNNYLGVTNSAIANGATGEVTMVGGVASNLNSLTANSDYYVQPNGTLTTASAYPAVKAGRALSSTSINLEYS